MNVVFDSSSLILLAKADVLRETCSIAEVIMVNEVESEVTEGLKKGRKDALFVQELVKEGKIRVLQTNKALAAKLREDFKLGLGETAAISLATTNSMPLATDDNKARTVGKVLGLSVLSSLDFPLLLRMKGVISHDKAKICLEVLKKEGWFSETVISHAFKKLEEAGGEKA